VGWYVGLAVVCAALTSCSLFFHKGKVASGPEQAAANAPAPPTAKDYENELRKTVAGAIETTNKTTEEQHGRVLKRKPYFLKEYDVYPDGPDNFKILIQEKDQKSSPYIADVTLTKQRFATRLHRKRTEAEADNNFLRDIGTETITYEVRNGKWIRVASMLVADKSEEKINGEWVPVKEAVKRNLPSDEDKSKGWLRRTWSSIFGM
jgi:hypothetical protein